MNKEAPLGVTLIGITNILVGIFFTIAFYLYFVFGVIFCYVSDQKDTNLLYWIWHMIIARLSIIISTFSSLSLIWAGIAILIMKNYSRKLTLVSVYGMAPALIIALADARFVSSMGDNFLVVIKILLAIFLYAIVIYIYLSKSFVKRFFNDEEVKFRYWKFIIIVIVVLILPLLAMKPYIIPPSPPASVYIPTN